MLWKASPGFLTFMGLLFATDYKPKERQQQELVLLTLSVLSELGGA